MKARVVASAVLAVVGAALVTVVARSGAPAPAPVSVTPALRLSTDTVTVPSGVDEKITVVLPNTRETVTVLEPGQVVPVLPRNQGKEFGHDNVDPTRQPTEAGLPTEGIPGTYVGAVPQSVDFTSYVWVTEPVATLEQARSTARSRFLEAKQLLVDQGWLVASEYVEFTYRGVPDADDSRRDIYVAQGFTRAGVMASLRVTCSRGDGFGYNAVTINAGPYYGPPADEQEPTP